MKTLIGFFIVLPLALSAQTNQTRPQEPVPPYPYIAEEVTFRNEAAGVTLAGTLTVPETGDNFTAVVLVTGSGPQNRDEEVMGHKPFLVIADHLTRNGIAVLRYDDRGVAMSTGDFTSCTIADFADDAQCAVEYLKTRGEINPAKIGLLGHSEGGTLIPVVAARTDDVAFIISLAGVALPGYLNALLQQEMMWRLTGVPEKTIAEMVKLSAITFDILASAGGVLSEEKIVESMTGRIAEIAAGLEEGGLTGELTAEEYIGQYAPQLASHARQYGLRFDPAPFLEKVKCPALALYGDKDLQVVSKENLEAYARLLKKGGNKDVTVKEYPGVNHLFQQCTTGFFDEYAEIEHTIMPGVLDDLAEWIARQ